MAGPAKLRRAIEIAHHGLLVQIDIAENFVLCGQACAWAPIGVEHDRGLAHHVAANPGRLLELRNRMANRTGDSILVERAIDFRTLCKRARKQRDRIVTALAVPRGFNSSFIDQHLHVVFIKRRTKRIRMGRLPPLPVSILVALAAIRRRSKIRGLQKPIEGSLGPAGSIRIIAERQTVRSRC